PRRRGGGAGGRSAGAGTHGAERRDRTARAGGAPRPEPAGARGLHAAALRRPFNRRNRRGARVGNQCSQAQCVSCGEEAARRARAAAEPGIVTNHFNEDDLTLYYYGEGAYRVDRVGRGSPRRRVDQPLERCPAGASSAVDSRRRILLTSVADHLDRSERVLTDIMNAPRGDISSEQRWADDLLSTSRLYRQDAADAGEQSVAAVLDELERSLLEIVNSPSKISAADLDEIRRRIDAAALLFKVRVMSDELRQREEAPMSLPRTSTRKTS